MIKFSIFINEKLSKAHLLKKQLIKILEKDWELSNNFQESEYIFVIGGDGTFLKHLKYYDNKKVISINAGNLGYFSYFNSQNIKTILKKIKDDKNFNNITLLELTLNDNKYYGINEILMRSDKTFESCVFVKNILFQKFKGTGIIVSTPMGSTAQTKNSHGAIIYPSLKCIQIVELEPITQKKYSSLKSPLIVPDDFDIHLKIKKDIELIKIIIDGVLIEEKISEDLKIKSINSNFKIYNPNTPKTYIKKLRDSFIRE